MLFKDSYKDSIEYAFKRISIFFNNIKEQLPEEWESGTDHYVRTNAGFVVFAGLLHDIITNLEDEEIKDVDEFKKITYKFIEPVLLHILNVTPDVIESYRGAGGAIQKSRQIRIEFLRKIRDAGIHFRSRWLEKIEESKKDKDEFEKIKKGIFYYLEREESEVLEFKGSLSFDIDRYLLGDGKQMENPKLIDEGVLKSIVAFLNTSGGTILIGILEMNKYEDVYQEKLEEYPLEENKIIFGIEHEYGKDEWDGYHQKLANLIETRIDPEVLDYKLVEISKVSYEDFDICKIEVTPSDTRQYLNNKDFFKRRGNMTKKLTGKDIDAYWRSKQ
ncbi:MAG: ATP-binding protein [Anaerolineales bacterium]